jgi:hypothetical protein
MEIICNVGVWLCQTLLEGNWLTPTKSNKDAQLLIETASAGCITIERETPVFDEEFPESGGNWAGERMW